MISNMQNSEIELEIGALEMEIENVRSKIIKYKTDIEIAEEEKKKYVTKKLRKQRMI
jgi:hypothetical protein